MSDRNAAVRPFSEQLGLFYRAPLGLVPLLVMLTLGAVSAVFAPAGFGPLGWLAQAVCQVVGLRYGLHLLQRFSQGVFDLGAVVADEARNPYTVYKVIVALTLLVLLALLLGVVFPALDWVLLLGVVCVAPLVVMLITLEDRFDAGLHPLRWLQMLGAIGGSYGWLLAMSFLVLTGSGLVDSWLEALLGEGLVVRLVQAVLAQYALCVVCCMMGYVLYERADRFGIETAGQRRDRLLGRAPVRDAQALLRQGDVEGALEAAAEEARRSVNDARVQERYFKLLQMRGDTPEQLLPQVTRWLKALAAGQRAEDCARVVQQWWMAHPTLLDEAPQALLNAARLAARGGAPHEALQMLAHFQRVQRGSMLMPQAVLQEAEIWFTWLREPLRARERLMDLLQRFPQAGPQGLEARALLKVIDAARQRPMAPPSR